MYTPIYIYISIYFNCILLFIYNNYLVVSICFLMSCTFNNEILKIQSSKLDFNMNPLPLDKLEWIS